MTSINFSTPVLIPKSNFTITHKESVLLIGSCFAQNIGEKLIEHKFNVNVNPSGIIFNPVSVVKALQRIVKNKTYVCDELIKNDTKWLSLDHHSSFSAFDKKECLEQINNSLKEAHQQLKKTKTIIITLGSAWVYEYENFGVVANCHKIPNKQFIKRLLSVKEILSVFELLQTELKGFNVVFTVSPVRHVRDGLHENNLSKATLLLAIDNLVKQNENYSYFPAYELVVDELRDYRFYKDDLVHPTNLAVNFVWERFSACYFNDKTQQLNKNIYKIQRALNHKPINKNSQEYKAFTNKTQQQIGLLKEKYPFLTF